MVARRRAQHQKAQARFEEIGATAELFASFSRGIGGPKDPSRLRLAGDLLGSTSVLDVGCGPGVFLQTLIENPPAERWRYAGVDGSAAMISRAATLAAGPLPAGARVSFQVADVEDLTGFAPQEFDAVVVRHVLEHLEEAVPALGECLRVCRSRLLLVFSQFPASGGYSILADTDMGVPRWAHSRERLVGVLEGAGFLLETADLFEILPVGDKPQAPILRPREGYWVASRNPVG